MGLIEQMSRVVKGNLERFFYWWGTLVTRHPYKDATFLLVFFPAIFADSASAEYCSTFTFPSVCLSVRRRDMGIYANIYTDFEH